jgi:hypothetical protein
MKVLAFFAYRFFVSTRPGLGKCNFLIIAYLLE